MTETQFRKKPVVINAFQMTQARRASNSDWPQWMNEAWQKQRWSEGSLYPTAKLTASGTLSCGTLEGQHLVSWGDWIIQGVKGEIYPCKPDIFELTYEPVAALHTQPTSAVVQNPVGYMVFWGDIGEKRPCWPPFTSHVQAAMEAASIKSNTEVRPLYAHPLPTSKVEPTAQPRERETDFQIALVKELADVKQSLLATQGQLETSRRMLGSCLKELMTDVAVTPPPVAGDAAELTASKTNIFSIIEDYAIAVSRKNAIHAAYLGRVMPDDICERFKEIRDTRIPAHRAEIKRAIDAAIAAGGSTT